MLDGKRLCHDCGEGVPVTRRGFMKAAAGAAAAFATARPSSAAPGDASPEKLVQTFYESLKKDQKKQIAFAWADPRRTKVANNWKIVNPQIRRFFNGEQQQLLRDIFKGLVSEEGYGRFQRQMKDDYDGFESYHVAVFGEPGNGKFEWVLTGRHLTIRCDGDTTDRVAFGGPIFYGHAANGDFKEAPDHPGNVWWVQAKAANKIFEALGGKQREKALLQEMPLDSHKSIEIRPDGPFAGIAIGDLSTDQRDLAEKCMKELLAPFRAGDVEEAMKYVKEGGGLDKVHLSFFREDNLGGDEVWDNWKLEGPTMAWYFRGAPHVHTWVNIVAKA